MSDFYLGETSYQNHINENSSDADFQQYNVSISELIFGDQSNHSKSSGSYSPSQIGVFDFNQTTRSGRIESHQGQYQISRAKENCSNRPHDTNHYRRQYPRDVNNSQRIDSRFAQTDRGCDTDFQRQTRQAQLERAARQSYLDRSRSNGGSELDYIKYLVQSGQLSPSSLNERFRNSPGIDGGSCTPIRWQDRRQDGYYQPRDSSRYDHQPDRHYRPRDVDNSRPRYEPRDYRPRQVDRIAPRIEPRDYRLDERHRLREGYNRPRYEPDCQPRDYRHDQYYRPGRSDRFYPDRGHQNTGDLIKGMILNQVLGGGRQQPFNRYQPRYYPQHDRQSYYNPQRDYYPRQHQNYRNNDVGAQIASFVIPMVINRIQRNSHRGGYRH